jgi:hypothetical protein
METSLGFDFGGVRVHTSSEADQAAAAVRARAFTVGHDIVFARGEYESGVAGNRRLLAHELTHVMQQERLGAGTLRLQRQGVDVDEDVDEGEPISPPDPLMDAVRTVGDNSPGLGASELNTAAATQRSATSALRVGEAGQGRKLLSEGRTQSGWVPSGDGGVIVSDGVAQ